MKNFKVWLVEAKKRKVYTFFEGKKRVTANDLNDLAEFRRKLQEDNPNDFWAVCTNECRTIFGEGVIFADGSFL
jgi:hypothetical protein